LEGNGKEDERVAVKGMTRTDTVGERRRAREALIESVTRLAVRSRKAEVDCDCRGSNGGGTILATASSARHVCSTHRLLIVGRFDDNALVLGYQPSTDGDPVQIDMVTRIVLGCGSWQNKET
jgi:hypothetical protein